jgi:hypothetical protein
MSGRQSSRIAYTSQGGVKLSTDTFSVTNVWVNYGHIAEAMAILIVASIRAAYVQDKSDWVSGNWPDVLDTQWTASTADHVNGEVEHDYYNVLWLLVAAGAFQTIMSVGLAIRIGCKPCASFAISDNFFSFIYMMENLGPHAVSGSLIGWVVYKHLDIRDPFFLSALIACHFLSFYIMSLLHGEVNDMKYELSGEASSKTVVSIRTVMAYMPPALVLWLLEAYIIFQNYTRVGYSLPSAAKAVAPMYFVLTTLGIISSVSGSLMPRDYKGIQQIIMRVAESAIRLTVVFILCFEDCHPNTWPKLTQAVVDAL